MLEEAPKEKEKANS